MEFIKFVLYKVWFNKNVISYVKGKECNKYFQDQYKTLDDKTLKKLKYLRKFLNTDEIHITCMSFNTKHDGDYNYYRNVLIKNNK